MASCGLPVGFLLPEGELLLLALLFLLAYLGRVDIRYVRNGLKCTFIALGEVTGLSARAHAEGTA